MTEARIFDLYDDPMPGISEFEGYAGETASALIQLTGMVLEPEGAMAAADAAGHAGIAQLVAGCLLLLPTHIARHQVFLPADILLSVGLNSEALLKSEDKVRIAAAIRAFAGYGRDHLAKARAAAAGKLAGPLACAFLPVSLAETIFDRAEKAGYGLLEKSIRPSQLARQWRLWRSFRSHRF
jgi:phytoene synthase